MDWLPEVGSTETRDLVSFACVQQPENSVVARHSPLICARPVPNLVFCMRVDVPQNVTNSICVK